MRTARQTGASAPSISLRPRRRRRSTSRRSSPRTARRTNAVLSHNENVVLVTTVTALDLGRAGGHLLDRRRRRRGPLHASAPLPALLSFVAAPNYRGAGRCRRRQCLRSDRPGAATAACSTCRRSPSPSPMSNEADHVHHARTTSTCRRPGPVPTRSIAIDPDKRPRPITYSIAGGADAALFAIDRATGALTFLTAPDFEAPADAGGNNVYDLVVASERRRSSRAPRRSASPSPMSTRRR